MKPEKFFLDPENINHKKYEALRAFYIDKQSGEHVAKRFGYTLNSFYSLTRDFKYFLSLDNASHHFFLTKVKGRKQIDQTGKIDQLIIDLRKKYLSVPDIKSVLDVQGHSVSEKYVYNILKKEGFARLPRRNNMIRERASSELKLEAPKSSPLSYIQETFSGQNSLGILCLLPYIQKYAIDRLILNSRYPETNTVGKLASILSFTALKLSNIRRYSADDIWCMDRGLGLFAGLNVLPKNGWYTSYSHRVTRSMNKEFLKGLHIVFSKAGLLSDTANIDFTTIPYWGDDSHLENNWSGTRNKALAAISAALAQDPDSGIITYGDANIRHEQKADTALEFLDFYNSDGGSNIRYLVFDSKFTTYENLAKLGKHVKFLTIRRRGKKIVNELNAKPASSWRKIRVAMANDKGRNLKVIDEKIFLKDYGGEIRQVAIMGHGKIKPALLITNDFTQSCDKLIRKYARRWLVEKSISEQIEFFHLNRVSSSMVIKVDFDLTMSILAHNILRLFAMELPGYSHEADYTLYNKFMAMSGSVKIDTDKVSVLLKKKRHLPMLLSAMEKFKDKRINILGERKLEILGDSTT